MYMNLAHVLKSTIMQHNKKLRKTCKHTHAHYIYKQGWAAVDEVEEDSEDEDEEEATKKEKESEKNEAEEIAAAKAAGITFRKKQSSIASKAKKRREEIRRKTLQGEEWSSDALLFWYNRNICILQKYLCI
jgi:hypothetical protein